MPCISSHAWIPIKKDGSAKLFEELSKAGNALDGPGLTHAYVGTALDPNEPAHVEIIGVFDSMASAKASPDHRAAFGALLAAHADPAGKSHHLIFTFNNDFVAVAAAPVVMFSTVVVPPAQADELEAAWGQVNTSGAATGTYGFGDAEVDIPNLGKGKIFMSATGWDSVASAEAARAASADKFKAFEKFGEAKVRFATLTQVK